MIIKETSLLALDRVTVTLEDINDLLGHTPCSFVFKELRKLHGNICNSTQRRPNESIDWYTIKIVAKIWLAGWLQGVRTERARRNVAKHREV